MSDYSQRELLQGIAKAKAAGDTEAVEWMRDMLRRNIQAEDSQTYDPTSGMSNSEKRWANVGAGVDNLVQGTKQLFGLASTDDIREKAARDKRLAQSVKHGGLYQGAGTALAAAPTMFIPGANSVTGAAAIGGLTGLMMPTESDNVIAGKMANTAIGAVGGGVAQKYLPGAMTAAGNKIASKVGGARDALVESGFTPAFMRQSLAERTFLQSLGTTPDKARRAIISHRDVPGTEPTASQIIGTPQVLGVERKLAETGGEAAVELGARRIASNEARYKFLRDELRKDPKKLWDAASKFAATEKKGMKLVAPIDPNRSLIGEVGRLRNNSTNKSYKAFWQNIQDELRTIRQLPQHKQVQAYHRFRMDTLDRELKALGGPGRSDIAADNVLKSEVMSIKNLLDSRLDNALGGQKWTQFLEGYAPKAQAARQAEAGVELLGKVDNLTPTPTGNPALTSGRRLIRNEVDAVDDWGNPRYNDTAADALRGVDRSIDVEMRPFAPGIRPSNSATAANINQATPAQIAARRLVPMMSGGGKAPVPVVSPSVAAGTVVGELAPEGASAYAAPKVAATIAGLNMVRNYGTQKAQGAAYDIAQRLFRQYADPQEALRVLNAAVQSKQIPAKLAMEIANEISKLGRPMIGGVAGGAAVGAAGPYAAAMIPAQQ